MADRWWRQGSGTWGADGSGRWAANSGDTNYTPGLTCTSSDNAYFDDYSGSSGSTVTVTIQNNAACRNLTVLRYGGVGTIGSLIFTVNDGAKLYTNGNVDAISMEWSSNAPSTSGIVCRPYTNSDATISELTGTGVYVGIGKTASSYGFNITTSISARVIDYSSIWCRTNGNTWQADEAIYLGNNGSYNIYPSDMLLYGPYVSVDSACNISGTSTRVYIIGNNTNTDNRFYGGGKTYGSLTVYSKIGDVLIYGSNTFSTVYTVTGSGESGATETRLLFQSGTTNTLSSFYPQHTGGSVYLGSQDSGTKPIITTAYNQNSLDYLVVGDIDAAGVGVMTLGKHCVLVDANGRKGSGWATTHFDSPGLFGSIF